MANLQQITLTVDELTPAGTLLYPSSGYEAIDSVTFKGLWDYWSQNCDWESVNGVNHGVLSLDSSYFIEAYPELEDTWTEDPAEIFLDPTTFNPVLASKNDAHASSRCGRFSFRTSEVGIYDANYNDDVYIPEMYWHLVEASYCTAASLLLRVFNETSLTANEISGGVLLKFLGTAFPGGTSGYGSKGSYYAYFVNSTSGDPSHFYLLGLESTAPHRIDPVMGDYVDSNQPNIINTIAAYDMWAWGAYDPTLCIKYLDQEITDY